MSTIKENLQQIETSIQESLKKSPYKQSVQIIAVTKSVSVERTEEAYDAGLINLGENRPEGLIEKWNALGEKPTWHYIGSLQTRKVKQILPYVDYIHSLDRMSLAEEINKRADKRVNCFVQVNVAEEEQKHGLKADEVLPFIESLKNTPNIYVVGLMTMAPFTQDEEVLRSTFKGLKQLQLQVQQMNLEYAPCTELSMGMSNDFAIAIEEGATYVRIGTALVG